MSKLLVSVVRGSCAISLLISAVAFAQPSSINSSVKVGAPFALTGSVAVQAQVMRQASELAMQNVNDQGGVLGRKLELSFADTACNPDKSVEVVQQMIQSGVVALVGPICSGETLRQARSVSIPAGVVTLSVASASSLITQLEDRDLVFRTAPSDAVKGSALAKQAWSIGVRRVSVSHAPDAYNTSVSQVFAAAFKSLGGQVAIDQTHELQQSDYQGEVRAVLSGAPDVALFAYSGSSGIQYLKSLLADPSVKNVFGTDGLMATELTAALTPEQLQKLTFVLAAADTEREGYKRWLGLANAAKIKPDAPYAANAYDATFMMALAIEAAGTADKNKIAAALRAISGPSGTVIYPGEFAKAKALLRRGVRINYDGASGPVDFDPAGDIAGRVSINRYRNGAWQQSLVN